MRPQAFVGRGLVLAALMSLPATAFAQSAISGVVRDTSGAVLPGVTVEASSPALIEKTRTAVANSGGLFTIVTCTGPCTPGALVIPNLTPASLVLALMAPGAEYYGQLHQVDISVRNITFGSSLGQPLDVLQPRLLRLAIQMRF